MKQTIECNFCEDKKKKCKARLIKPKRLRSSADAKVYYYETDCGKDFTTAELDSVNLKLFNTRKKRK